MVFSFPLFWFYLNTRMTILLTAAEIELRGIPNAATAAVAYEISGC